MAYRADIEIGVKGTRELERLRSLITQTTTAFESLNRIATTRGGLNQTLANYETQLVRAKRAIDNVTAGTQAEIKAIREYVTAMGLANAARDRQNYLIAQEIANRRRVQATVNAGFGQQGPALAPTTATRKGTGPASTLGGGRLGGIVSNAVIGGAFPLLFGQGGAAATGGALGGIVGGAFGGAGGFAGSLLGTLLGQIAGQANQVKELGNDLGFSAKQTQQLGIAFKQAGADFDKFAESISRIQGLGLTLEEQASAVRLASTLTEEYKGKIDKITNAFTNALQTGKVTQATLNQLTSQGVPIQQALADKYKVSRSAILEMAKDGKISVQDLLDTLVDLANESSKGAPKLQASYEVAFNEISNKLQTLSSNVAAAFAGSTDDINTSFDFLIQKSSSSFSAVLDALSPLTVKVAELAANLIDVGTQAAVALLSIPNYAETASKGIMLMIPGLRAVVDLFGAINAFTGKGAKRTAQETGMFGRYVPGSQQQEIKTPIPRISALGQMTPTGGGGGKGKKGAGDNAAAREAERVAKLLRDTQAETQLLGIQAQLQQRIFAAEQARDPLLVARLEGERKILDIQFQTATKLAEEKNVRAQEAIVANGLAQVDLARLSTAQKLQEIETERRTQLSDRLIALEREAELNNITNEYARELRQIEFDILDLRKQGIIVSEAEANAYRTRAKATKQTPAQKIYSGMQQELEQLIAIENVAAAGARNIGDAFGQAFQQVITGSTSAQEALAGMMQSIGENFVNMAAQIIAQQITMIIYGTILRALGLAGGIVNANTGGFAGMTVPNNALGEAMTFQMMSFAEGGFVTGPTQAVVGEGGEPEYIIPASKMSAAMARYSAGARGESVIPSNGGSDMMATGTVPGTATIDIRYSVERINNVDYVTAEEFQRGMAAAAQQGAKQGEVATLRRLQQSTSTRSRLGIR